MLRKIRDINATRTSGSGELYALPKTTERAIPVVATAQFVVESRRVRQILLRYISPLYRWASIPSSAALNGFFGGSATLMSFPSVKVRHEVRKGATARKVKNRQIGCQCHSDCIHLLPKTETDLTADYIDALGYDERYPEVLPRKDSYGHPPITSSKSVKSWNLWLQLVLREGRASGASATSQFEGTLLCRCKL